MQDVLTRGLEQNSDLRGSYLKVLASEQQIFTAESLYETQGRLQAGYEDSELPGSQGYGQDGSTTLSVQAGLSRRLRSGTSLSAEGGVTSVEYPSPEGPAAEISTSLLQLKLQQDLLRDWGGAVSQARVESARKAYEAGMARYYFERDRLAAELYRRYWDVFAARKLVELNRASLDRARDLLRINRQKEQDGLLDETDVLAAEAAIALREVELLENENQFHTAREGLLQRIRYPVEAWDEVVLDVDADRAETHPALPGAAVGFETAVKQRADLEAARLALRAAEVQLAAAERGTRPDLSLEAGIGRGGSGASVSDSMDFDKTVWSVGAALSSSLSRTGDKAEAARLRFEVEAAEEDLRDLESSILLECRSAARNLQTALKRVDAAEKAAKLQRSKLEQEQDKMEQGRSTTAVVIQYMDDLDMAEWTVIRAQAEAQVLWAEYQRVQGILVQETAQP